MSTKLIEAIAIIALLLDEPRVVIISMSVPFFSYLGIVFLIVYFSGKVALSLSVAKYESFKKVT